MLSPMLILAVYVGNRVQESHLTNRSKVLRLLTNWLEVQGVETAIQGQLHSFYADIVGCLWRY